MATVKGTFTVDSWDPTTYDEAAGAKLARVVVTKTFYGDLEGGTSVTHILTAEADRLESMAYVGFERFTGKVDGKAGTFVLMHSATSLDGDNTLRWTILPGSGSGELAGITGEGQITVDADRTHRFSLGYEV